jgi:hypothetical protein
MADFDLNSAPILQKGSSQAAFNLDDAPMLQKSQGSPQKSMLDRNMEGMYSWATPEGLKHAGQGAYDFLQGLAAGNQNTFAFATQGLPKPLQVPRANLQPTSGSSIPMEAGKIGYSFMPGIGTEKAVLSGLEGISQIPALLSRTIAGTAGGIASSPSVDANPLVGGAIGATGAVVPEAIMQGIGKYLGRNVTPQEFQAAREAVPEGIKAPIGELAKSPRAKRDYGFTRSVAFSGADKPYMQMYDYLKGGVKKLGGEDIPENTNEYIYDALSNQYRALKGETNSNYKALADYADQNRIKFNDEDYLQNINGALREIGGKTSVPNTSKYEASISQMSSLNPRTKSLNEDVTKLYDKSKKTLENFRDTPIDSFNDAINLRTSLNKIIKERYNENDLQSVRYLEKIKEGLDKSIQKSGQEDPVFYGLHQKANQSRINQGEMEKINRKDKSPFYKAWLKDGAPSNLIGQYLKTGEGKDFSPELQNLVGHLSEKDKGILGSYYLNPKEDMSVAKQVTKLGKLSPQQQQLLFGQNSPLAANVSKLGNLYGESTVADFVPKTGWSGGKSLQTLALLKSLGTFGLLPAASQAGQRFLRSDALKDAYARFLQGQKGAPLTQTTNKGRVARNALIAALGGSNNGS